MKKTFAFILAMLMLVGMLAGCGKDNQNSSESKSEETTNNGTQTNTQTQVVVGDILDAPEVRFDTSIEDLYIYFTYPSESGNGVLSMELAIDQVTADSYTIYVTNGLLKTDETIYEITDAGITKYRRNVLTNNFEQDTVLTQAELKQEEANFCPCSVCLWLPIRIGRGCSSEKLMNMLQQSPEKSILTILLNPVRLGARSALTSLPACW